MKIALFGAGRNGKNILYNIGKNKITYFIDNIKKGDIDGVPIIPLTSIPAEDKENLLILITSKKYKEEMIAQLEREGYTNYFIYEDKISASKTKERLSENQWGDLYNDSLADTVIQHLNSNNVSIQTQEMIKITQRNDKILEIGCGSGETALALAKAERNVSAIDYSSKSIGLVNSISRRLGYKVNTYCIDALGELPFEDKEFDVVFHAGLLEHFEKETRIKMLLQWKRICKRMVSLIPNAHCMAYRAGKKLAEENGTWPWGLELPQSTLRDEFEQAGYTDIQEYSIGEQHALNFLPENHYMRVAIGNWINENREMNDWGQGYLLVTIAENCR